MIAELFYFNLSNDNDLLVSYLFRVSILGMTTFKLLAFNPVKSIFNFRNNRTLLVQIKDMYTTNITSRPATSDETIREKFETSVYTLSNVPEVVRMSHEGIFVNEHVPYPDLISDTNAILATNRNVQSRKLKATSGGDWDFAVCSVKKSFFKSRQALDEMMVNKELFEKAQQCIQAARMSIKEAMQRMFVECSCDMDYYLANRGELEADLGRQLAVDFDTSDGQAVQKLEQELFYVNMCKIFGPESDDDRIEVGALADVSYDKSFMLTDFNILAFNGNDMYATAIRGDYYLLFYFYF